MSSKEELEELRRKAKFLEEEKKRIVEARKKRKEIERLQLEIQELEAEEISESQLPELDPESSFEYAKREGKWPDKKEDIMLNPHVEEKWLIEKAKIENDKTAAKRSTEKALLGCFGILAFFLPIFWPFFIVQSYRAYPITTWSVSAAIILLIALIIAAS